MYIIDSNKDFYDYHSHVYGVDKSIIYDRRGSEVLNDAYLLSLSQGNLYTSVEIHLLLEVGFVQYLFLITDLQYEQGKRYSFPNEVIDFNLKMVQEYHNYNHYFDSPVSIQGVNVCYQFRYHKGKRKDYNYSLPYEQVVQIGHLPSISNPILKDTRLTKHLDSHLVWMELQTYISSLGNDKDVNLKMTDKEKAEIHGFDKKSFRY